MQDPNTNKSKGFGFCEYEDAEGVLRALRLLHNLSLDGQELLLKCNTATQRYIDDYQASKQQQAERKKQEATQPKADGSDESKADSKPEEGSTDDQQDDAILAKVMSLVSDRAAQQASSAAADQATEFLNDVLPPPPSRGRRGQPREPASSSKERSHTSHDKERGTSADRDAERQFERERQKEKRELEMRQADQERAYQKRLREWEQTERYTISPADFATNAKKVLCKCGCWGTPYCVTVSSCLNPLSGPTSCSCSGVSRIMHT